MTTAISEAIEIEVRAAPSPDELHEAQPRASYSAVAVVQANRWVAVSPELGAVAEGRTADEALDNLEAAVRDVIEIAHEEGLPAGEAMSPEELAELVTSHREATTAPVTMRTFIL